MNIVHFVYDYLPISETFIYNDITSIKKHNISVLSAKTRNMHLFPFKQIHSIDRLGIPAKYSEFARFKLFDSSEFFKKTILGTKAKLIHAHFGHIGAKLLKIKSTTKIPMITGFYGADIPILRNSGKAERLFSAGEAFIALSDDMKMDLMSIGCPEEKIRVRDVGIDISKFRFEARKPNGNLRFLCVARMVEKKGLPYLIQSMKKIAAALPEATLDIIGDGPMRGELETLVRHLGLENNVRLLGSAPYGEVIKHYYQSHIFVLPSVTDRAGGKDEFSTVIKEAMCSGMPVIATSHAGIPKIIKNGVNGFLVPEKDADALAEAAIGLVARQKTWKAIAMRGRKTIEKLYDIKQRARYLEKLYSEITRD